MLKYITPSLPLFSHRTKQMYGELIQYNKTKNPIFSLICCITLFCICLPVYNMSRALYDTNMYTDITIINKTRPPNK